MDNVHKAYEDYLRRLLRNATDSELSLESRLLRADAATVLREKGGKFLGIALLERLIGGFGNSTLKIPKSIIAPADSHVSVSLPSDFTRAAETDYVIIRSNATFEYGSPPGLLESLHLIPFSTELTIDVRVLIEMFSHAARTYLPDSKHSLHLLIQPQMFPRASGVMHTSFSGRPEDPVIIEASTGPCISATAGLPNIVQYRISREGIEAYRNFEGEAPYVMFSGRRCYLNLDYGVGCQTERSAYKKAATEFIPKWGEGDMLEVWTANTFPLGNEKASPLKEEELRLLYTFGKYAETILGKPLKMEFSIANNGSTYFLQLDPAYLEVSDQPLDLEGDGKALLFRTPFVNMPAAFDELDVVIEALFSSDVKTQSPFAYMTYSVPLNVNILGELLAPFPNCRTIVSATGSRINHTYSDARTFIPYIGVPGLHEAITNRFGNARLGYMPDLKMDIRSDGRWGRVRIRETP